MITKGQIVQFEEGEYDDYHVFAERRALRDFDLGEQLARFLLTFKKVNMWETGRQEFVDFLTINEYVARLADDELVSVHLGSYDDLRIRER